MSFETFEINGIKIGKEFPCYVIAEIGINHNGDIKIAKKLIDSAIEVGANAVKFQKRNLNELYLKDVLENPNIESQGLEILLDVLKEVEFSDDDFIEIINYCKEKKITFLCTPWDISSVNFLEKQKISAYKIASADLTNFPLIKKISETKKPILISTGMSTIDEIEKTINFLNLQNANFLILHCNSTYPAPVETLNLKLINDFEQKFKKLIGYSGHEQGIIPSLTAVNLGSVLVERHITLDKTMEGLDQASSLTPDEFSLLVKFIRESESAKGNSVKKMTRGEILQREVLSKSIVCSKNIKTGEFFSEKNISVKGPAKGLSPQYYYELLGKKSKRDIFEGNYLQSDDL